LNAYEVQVLEELERVVARGEAVLLGPVRQELLSGIKEVAQFRRIRAALRAFPDGAIRATDYERAAEMANACRAGGVQGSPTDFLICAVSERLQATILTGDRDFLRFESLLRIQVHDIP
jgi:predicted nucleic acid-binding protein